MNSKKARHEARLLRRMNATHEAQQAASAANDAELLRLKEQIKAADARGEQVPFPPPSVKMRKQLRRLYSDPDCKKVTFSRQLSTKAQRSEHGGK
jgi:hypothetical protein